MNEDIQHWIKKISEGDRTTLSKAITLAESKLDSHQILAHDIISALIDKTGNSKRIAITGVPGAGKSTLIESFGNFLISLGKKVAVLAVDPTSALSGGSILGDKTRMDSLAINHSAYIRPSATGGTLGGITTRTYEAILLCEAAGYDVILVETVGVGQSETLVNEITDFFLFLQIAGAGDSLQGIKRGIMEMADVIFLNKTDNVDPVLIREAKLNLNRSFQFLPSKGSNWKRKIIKGSAINNVGIKEIWQDILSYYDLIEENGYFERMRKKQQEIRMIQYAEELVLNDFKRAVLKNKSIDLALDKNPFQQAQDLFNEWKKKS